LRTETGRKLSIPFRDVNDVIGTTSIAQYRGVLVPYCCYKFI